MDNSAELTAGALRSKPEESIASARELFFTRGYPDWQALVKAEAALPESERIDYLTIVTPNDAHFGPADAAAAAGIGVLCEKPLTTTLDEARRLHATVASKDVPFVVAYTYTGFPMVMLARELVHDGAIGEVRKVEAWYPQGWLATKLEAEGQKQASWRVDPAQGGRLGLRRRHRHPRLRVRPVRRRPPRHAAPRPAQDVRPRPRPRRRLHRPGRARQRRDRHHHRLADHHRRPERQRLPRQRHDRHARMVDHRPHRPEALRRRPAAAALPPGGRVRLFPRLDQALPAAPLGPPRRLPRGPRQPAPDPRMDHPRPPRREGPHPVRAPRHRSTASPAWPSSRPPSPARTRTGPGSRCPRSGRMRGAAIGRRPSRPRRDARGATAP